MKLNKTIAFALLTAVMAFSVYLFEYKKDQLLQKDEDAVIISYPADQISYFQVVKPSIKIGLQKGETGWTLLEPIHEPADNTVVEELLNTLTIEKPLAVVKISENALTETELSEYGLDKPAIVFNFKNNQGLAKKISVGSIKNFEGKSFLQVDADNRILLANNIWSAKAADELIYYRDKRVYRDSLANVTKVKIQSLRDKFELKRSGTKWISSEFSFELDQNKVRDMLRKISEANIEDYVFEGEPSVSILKEKEIDSTPVQVELSTESSVWSAKMNINSKDHGLYILTDRPTYLAKADPILWEVIGNQSLDALRDRVTAFSFNTDEVKKLYFKQNAQEVNLIYNSGSWLMSSTNSPYLEADSNQIAKILKKIHDLKISEFLDSNANEKFSGTNMLILKSETEKLVLQLNWGPLIKLKKGDTEHEYYMARTHLSDSTFALEKALIDNLELEPTKMTKKSDGIEAPPPPVNPEK